MKRTRSLIPFLFVATTLTAAHAQKNEFTVMASTFQTSAGYNAHGGQGLQLNYARRIVNIEVASLYLELPFAARCSATSTIISYFQSGAAVFQQGTVVAHFYRIYIT